MNSCCDCYSYCSCCSYRNDNESGNGDSGSSGVRGSSGGGESVSVICLCDTIEKDSISNLNVGSISSLECLPSEILLHKIWLYADPEEDVLKRFAYVCKRWFHLTFSSKEYNTVYFWKCVSSIHLPSFFVKKFTQHQKMKSANVLHNSTVPHHLSVFHEWTTRAWRHIMQQLKVEYIASNGSDENAIDNWNKKLKDVTFNLRVQVLNVNLKKKVIHATAIAEPNSPLFSSTINHITTDEIDDGPSSEISGSPDDSSTIPVVLNISDTIIQQLKCFVKNWTSSFWSPHDVEKIDDDINLFEDVLKKMMCNQCKKLQMKCITHHSSTQEGIFRKFMDVFNIFRLPNRNHTIDDKTFTHQSSNTLQSPFILGNFIAVKGSVQLVSHTDYNPHISVHVEKLDFIEDIEDHLRYNAARYSYYPMRSIYKYMDENRRTKNSIKKKIFCQNHQDFFLDTKGCLVACFAIVDSIITPSCYLVGVRIYDEISQSTQTINITLLYNPSNSCSIIPLKEKDKIMFVGRIMTPKTVAIDRIELVHPSSVWAVSRAYIIQSLLYGASSIYALYYEFYSCTNHQDKKSITGNHPKQYHIQYKSLMNERKQFNNSAQRSFSIRRVAKASLSMWKRFIKSSPVLNLKEIAQSSATLLFHKDQYAASYTNQLKSSASKRNQTYTLWTKFLRRRHHFGNKQSILVRWKELIYFYFLQLQRKSNQLGTKIMMTFGFLQMFFGRVFLSAIDNSNSILYYTGIVVWFGSSSIAAMYAIYKTLQMVLICANQQLALLHKEYNPIFRPSKRNPHQKKKNSNTKISQDSHN